MKKLALIVFGSILLAACSPEDIFSLLARSDVEQAAEESIEKSSQVVESKTQEMTTLKEMYAESADIEDVTGGGSFGTAYRNEFSQADGFTHEVIAVLPGPIDGNFYEGWLVNPDTNDFISTGKMGVTDDFLAFNLKFTSATDYTDHPKVVITLETTEDNTPETHVLEGSF